MKIYVPCLISYFGAILLLLWTSSCNNLPKDANGIDQEAFHTEWAMDDYWDDGKAEVAIYDAVTTIYNKPRTHQFTIITVKEDFNSAFKVKTDDYDRSDLYPVMKVNRFARVETDNYPYQIMGSQFYHRKTPGQIHKYTYTSQEWCGNVFKQFMHEGEKLQYQYHSYWDEEGDGNNEIPDALLLEEQLPYTLRSLRFEDGLSTDFSMLVSQENNKAALPEANHITLSVSEEVLQIGDNSYDCWQVTTQAGEGKAVEYWFEKAYPNRFIQQKGPGEKQLVLREISRYAYWEH